MSLLDIVLIGIGLAMDCFAVSLSHGLGARRWYPMVVVMALAFGLFQGGMPLIGYFAGTLFATFFSRFAPWIALALLAVIGGKMVWESLHEGDEDKPCKDLTLPHILVLAVATSIDALATGVIFIPQPDILWLGVSVIAFISFLFALAGYGIGVVFGTRFRINMELVGGLILILISLKIWAQGLFF